VEDVSPDLLRCLLVFPPLVIGIGLQAGSEVERPRIALQLWVGVPMHLLGGHRKDRIRVTHRRHVEVAEEIPEQRMGDETGFRHREMNGQPAGLEAMVQVGRALDLEDQPGCELPANMRFQVPALVIGHGSRHFELAVAAQHQELHELALGDDPLLGRADRRHATSMRALPQESDGQRVVVRRSKAWRHEEPRSHPLRNCCLC